MFLLRTWNWKLGVPDQQMPQQRSAILKSKPGHDRGRLWPHTTHSHHPKLDHFRLALNHMDGRLWFTYGFGDAKLAHTFMHVSEKFGHAWSATLGSWSTMLRTSFSLWKTEVPDVHISSTLDEEQSRPEIRMKICQLAYQITASFVVTVEIVVHSSGPWAHLTAQVLNWQLAFLPDEIGSIRNIVSSWHWVGQRRHEIGNTCEIWNTRCDWRDEM